MRNIKDSSFLVILLYFLTSIICYWGLSQISLIGEYIIISLVVFFDVSPLITLYYNLVISGLSLCVILFILFKVNRIKNCQIENYTPIFLKRKEHFIKFGLLILGIYILVIVGKLTIQDTYQELVHKSLEGIKTNEILGLSYLDAINTGLAILKRVTIVILFILLVKKLPFLDNDSISEVE